MSNRKGRYIDLTGQIFGELTALSYNPGTHTEHSTWDCRCSCGRIVPVPAYALRAGHYKSCGCKRVANRDQGVKEHIERDRVEGTRISALKQKAHKDSISGVKGVCWLKDRQKWKAYITVAGKTKSLGNYDDKNDAIKARQKAEEIYHKPILEDNQSCD